MFQKPLLLPWRTTLENVLLPLEMERGGSVVSAADITRARRILDMVQLPAFGHVYPHQLSGGMRQRVGLARALTADTDIILMDEAFSALDPLIRGEMQEQLLDLQDKLKKTIVFITHDLDEAVRIGNKIAILRDGVLIQVGSPDEILNSPADDYVKRFVEKRASV